jgi:hypothetical protein
VETAQALDVEAPVPLRLDAGTQAELLAPASSARLEPLLLKEAAAEGPDSLQLSVLSGEARSSEYGIPAGTVAVLRAGRPPAPGILTEEDRARIEGWRAERLAGLATRRYAPEELAAAGDAVLEQGVARLRGRGWIRLKGAGPRLALAAEVRVSGAHLMLRYPLHDGGTGETTLGSLPAWRDGGWHRLAVRTGRDGAEVFLDGRRILKSPPHPVRGGSPGELALGAEGGSLDLKSLALGED